VSYDDKLAAMLERDEGRVKHVYFDSLGYATIGVGHLVDKRLGGGLPDAIIDALLKYDIAEKTAQLVAQFPWAAKLDDARRAVLVSMTFQLGIGGLLGFRNSMQAMQEGNWSGAATRFLQSRVAREQAPQRWQRFAQQIRSGQWQ
jgi:lysozyme